MQRSKKVILVALFVSLLSVGIVGAWDILTVQGAITVTEPITVRPSTITITANAGETKFQNITIRNSASANITVWLTIGAQGGLGYDQLQNQGILITPSSVTNLTLVPNVYGVWKFIAPPKSSVIVTLTITISQGAPPADNVQVAIKFARGENVYS